MKKRAMLFKSTALLISFILLAPMFTSKKGSKGSKKLFVEDDLLILTYNIGDCTFGETNFSVPYRNTKENLEGIISLLEEKNYDICLFQESNWLNITNYLINPSQKIARNFSNDSFIYGSNTNILNYCDNGNMTLTKFESDNKCFQIPIKGEGFINDKFYIHKLLIETRIKVHDTDKELVIYNIHLAPYSKNKEVRLKQIEYILNQAKSEYLSGNYIVIGGDWNINLSNKEFKELFNLVFQNEPWDYENINSPTHQFIDEEGNTKNSTIDGFLLSPNLNGDIKSLEIFDYSDHSPVELKLRLKK